MVTDERECVLCGRCLEVCPLVLATGREELSPKAKQYLAARLRQSPGELAAKPARDLATLCLGCGRCLAACTQELSTPDMLALLRAEHPGWVEWFWKTWVGRGALLWPAAAALGRFAPEKLPSERVRSMVSRLKAMGEEAGAGQWLEPSAWDRSRAGERVLLFDGCTSSRVQHYWRSQARMALRGLRFVAVDGPGFTCCGKTVGGAGLGREQLAMERANLAVWREADRPLLVAYCATCLQGLRAYAGREELDWEPGEAERWLGAVTPLSELWGGTSFRVLDNAPGAVYYHQPCHMAKPDPDLAWLRSALGPKLAGRTSDRCCGMGGVMQLSGGSLPDRVAASCWEKLAPEPGSVVLTGCSGCVLQLRATAPEGVRVAHWLDILAGS